MVYKIFNTNDPDVFDSVSHPIEADNYDRITAVETIGVTLEILRYLAQHGEVYVHKFSIFEPLPRYALPLMSANPKIYVTTLPVSANRIRLQIYVPKILCKVAVYVKLTYGYDTGMPA
jgi:hypothetical protein